MLKLNLTLISLCLFLNRPEIADNKIVPYHSPSLQKSLRNGVHDMIEAKHSIEVPTQVKADVNNRYNNSIRKRITNFIESGETKVSPK